MNKKSSDQVKVFSEAGKKLVQLPKGRAEELRHHLLLAHGIRSQVIPAEAAHERLEVNGDWDLEKLREIVDRWMR